MNILIRMVAVGAIVLASFSSHAGLIASDVENMGDGEATLDTRTGLEWLNLNNTASKSYSHVSGLLDTQYLGWRLPTHTELIDLFSGVFQSYGDSTVSTFTPSSDEQSLWRSTLSNDGSRFMGIYKKDDGTLGQSGLWYSTFYTPSHISGSGFPSDYRHPLYGVYLVSDGGITLSSINDPSLNINNPDAPVNSGAIAVPEPASILLFGLSLIGLGARRMKKT
jgi:hypothetical protein